MRRAAWVGVPSILLLVFGLGCGSSPQAHTTRGLSGIISDRGGKSGALSGGDHTLARLRGGEGDDVGDYERSRREKLEKNMEMMRLKTINHKPYTLNASQIIGHRGFKAETLNPKP
jgi:hypothetical protein